MNILSFRVFVFIIFFIIFLVSPCSFIIFFVSPCSFIIFLVSPCSCLHLSFLLLFQLVYPSNLSPPYFPPRLSFGSVLNLLSIDPRIYFPFHSFFPFICWFDPAMHISFFFIIIYSHGKSIHPQVFPFSYFPLLQSWSFVSISYFFIISTLQSLVSTLCLTFF